MSNPAFREITMSVPASGMAPFHAPFNCLFIFGVTGGTVRLKIGDGGQEADQAITAGRKYRLPDGEIFGRLEFYNTGGAAVSVRFGLALGDIDDTSTVFQGGALAVSDAQASSTVTLGGKIDVRTTPTIPANTSRKSIDIKNVGTAVLYLRPSVSSGAGADDSHGLGINPGEIYSAPTTASLSFRDNTSLGAGVQLYTYLEFT